MIFDFKQLLHSEIPLATAAQLTSGASIAIIASEEVVFFISDKSVYS